MECLAFPAFDCITVLGFRVHTGKVVVKANGEHCVGGNKVGAVIGFFECLALDAGSAIDLE